jgi:hypothetical protein
MLVTCALAVTPLVAGAGATVAEARQSAPYCGIAWGSLSKTSGPMTSAPVTGARVGRLDCYDRLVVDIAGTPAPGFDVRYTDGFTSVGPGNPLGVAGGAILTVKVVAPAYDSAHRPTVGWTEGTSIVGIDGFTAGGFRTFRDLVYGGSAETGDCDHPPVGTGAHHDGFYCTTNPPVPVNWLPITKLGLGVRARLPFRVFTLAGPGSGTRLVIDVAHQW